MDPGRGAPTVPRLLVATVLLLAASALFGWGYVVGRQAPAAPVERGSAPLTPPASSPSSAEIEAREAFDREVAGLAQSQREVARLRALFEEEKARIVAERIRLAASRANPTAARIPAEPQASIIRSLSTAADRLLASDYDSAIALYDEALKLDPTNLAALTGKAGAVSAKAIRQAAAAGAIPAAVRSFQAGTTSATSVESRVGAVPEGFEVSPGVSVKKGTTAAELPGKIRFEFTPQAPKAGERYQVKVSLMNEGTAPIGIANVVTTTTINGKKLQGPVPPLTKEAAPHQTAPVFEISDNWKDETTSWSMEVTLRTTAQETYRNSLTWK